MHTVFLFPGQGSQRHDMFQPYQGTKHFELIKQLVEDELQEDVNQYTADFSSTRHVQLALLIVGVSSSKQLVDAGIRPDCVAGHSAGAYSAAVLSEVLTLKDAIRLVDLRGRLMEQAFPSGYGMIAVQGLDLNVVVQVINAHQDDVYLANENAQQQVVLSGSNTSLRAIRHTLKEKGARRVIPLSVTVPSHSPLFTKEADQLRNAMKNITIRAPKLPYVSNQTARLLRNKEAIVEDLAGNIASTVKWHTSMKMLTERGIMNFIQLPPGSIYSDLLEGAFEGIQALSVEALSVDYILQLVQKE
ncbi:ACP S-malonyltransferase [Geomicrobium sp. JCM 19038]|uniref:ACP S-malonyltransferase n=1 Tax=Geomicrobium sp. JCM 19038 TaxID=1460635 RepID=UPI00045F453F|nr:malonate decarboxylase subunit epsilon [Geomicrobium sp. JCM 19038]GAK06855.1 malonyl CoA acyl carrier protein transacylase [Geomicrobium sp. JCM 19038]